MSATFFCIAQSSKYCMRSTSSSVSTGLTVCSLTTVFMYRLLLLGLLLGLLLLMDVSPLVVLGLLICVAICVAGGISSLVSSEVRVIENSIESGGNTCPRLRRICCYSTDSTSIYGCYIWWWILWHIWWHSMVYRAYTIWWICAFGGLLSVR